MCILWYALGPSLVLAEVLATDDRPLGSSFVSASNDEKQVAYYGHNGLYLH